MIEVRFACHGDPMATTSVARALAERYLIFDAHVAGERRVDVHPVVLAPELHHAAASAAERVVRAVSGVSERAHRDDKEAARYDLDADTRSLARASRAAGDLASFMRVDLLLDEQGGWQACEINADCPGGHNEAIGLPQLARDAGFLGGSNPTDAVFSLVRRIAALAEGGAVALVYATAYAEDLQVCAIVKRALVARGIKAILTSPTALRERGGDIYVGKQRISVLYRYFPTEWMSGQDNVSGIARAVEAGRVKSITSFAHVYTQSKLGFARACALAAELPAEDCETIERHLPFTADLREVAPEMLIAAREGWVVKRAMGRVGDQVFVGPLFDDDAWRSLVLNACAARARGEPWLAQRFIRQRPIPTPWGPRYITLGAYVLEGRFCGYFARLTPETHVSFDALCLPVFVAPTAVGGA